MKIIRENDKYYLLQQDKKLEFTGEAHNFLVVYEHLKNIDIAKGIKFKTCLLNENLIHDMEEITIYTDVSNYFFKNCKHFFKTSKNVWFMK